MDMKRLVIGTIAGAVVMYLVGIAFWGTLFADFFAANAGSAEGVNRAEEIVWASALGTLFYALLVTMMMEARGAKSAVDGLMVGAVVGFLIWGTADFIMFGNFNLNSLTGTIADTVLEGVRGGIGGAAIALALSKAG